MTTGCEDKYRKVDWECIRETVRGQFVENTKVEEVKECEKEAEEPEEAEVDVKGSEYEDD